MATLIVCAEIHLVATSPAPSGNRLLGGFPGLKPWASEAPAWVIIYNGTTLKGGRKSCYATNPKDTVSPVVGAKFI